MTENKYGIDTNEIIDEEPEQLIYILEGMIDTLQDHTPTLVHLKLNLQAFIESTEREIEMRKAMDKWELRKKCVGCGRIFKYNETPDITKGLWHHECFLKHIQHERCILDIRGIGFG